MKKVPLREIVARSPEGEAARRAAIAEDSRLLYVSMTRARDLMIFAMPKLDWDDDQWLGITGATDLLPVRNDAGEFEFSAARTLWQFRYCEPASEDQTPTQKEAIALHWFTEAGAEIGRASGRESGCQTV